MKTFLVNLCITLFLLVGYESCLQAPQVLPPITTEGNGTLGFKLNGAVWLPKGVHSGTDATVTTMSDTTRLYLSADNSNSSIQIYIYDAHSLTEGKTYDLSDKEFHAHYAIATQTSACQYQTITSGSITILRFDSVKGIVSGTFEFNASTTTSGCSPATVEITEGRFDFMVNS